MHKSSFSNKPPLGSMLDWDNPLASGIIGCWLYNEGSGKIATDLSSGIIGELKDTRFMDNGLYIGPTESRMTVPLPISSSLYPNISVELLFLSGWDSTDGLFHFFFDWYMGANSRYLLSYTGIPIWNGEFI